MIRVLVVDDHRLLREGVKLLLETVDGVTVAAEAQDGQQALAMIERCAPDVVLTDARMPGMDGVDLVAACRLTARQRCPIDPHKGQESRFFRRPGPRSVRGVEGGFC